MKADMTTGIISDTRFSSTFASAVLVSHGTGSLRDPGRHTDHQPAETPSEVGGESPTQDTDLSQFIKIQPPKLEI